MTCESRANLRKLIFGQTVRVQLNHHGSQVARIKSRDKFQLSPLDIAQKHVGREGRDSLVQVLCSNLDDLA